MLTVFHAFIALSCFGAIYAQVRITNIRLAGGTVEREGRVEIEVNGEWGLVCDDDLDSKDAGVMCRMVGFLGVGRTTSPDAFGIPAANAQFLINNVACEGNEGTLDACPFTVPTVGTCSRGEEAAVYCLGDRISTTTSTTIPTPTTTLPPRICNTPRENEVRLVNGPNIAEGRVQVKRAADNEWGEICDDFWGLLDAQIICNMLCYNPNNARALLGGTYGNRTQPYLLDDVECDGTEDSIFACKHADFGVHNCDVTEAAGVSCIQERPTPSPLNEPIVQCPDGPDEAIVAKFSRSIESRLQKNHVTVLDPGSNCDFRTDIDTRFVTIFIPFVGCNTLRQENVTYFSYSNTVRYEVPPATDVISRSTIYEFPVICHMGRNGDEDRDVDTDDREPERQEGEGHFNLKFYLFRDNRFDQIKQEEPLIVTLGDHVYAALVLTSTDPKLKLVVPQCYATPEADPESDPKYFLVKDKCKEEPSLTFYPINETMFAFRFQSFRFAGNETQVYLHCKGIVCDLDAKSAMCDRTCGTALSRRKREERYDENRAKLRHFHVSTRLRRDTASVNNGGQVRFLGVEDGLEVYMADMKLDVEGTVVEEERIISVNNGQAKQDTEKDTSHANGPVFSWVTFYGTLVMIVTMMLIH